MDIFRTRCTPSDERAITRSLSPQAYFDGLAGFMEIFAALTRIRNHRSQSRGASIDGTLIAGRCAHLCAWLTCRSQSGTVDPGRTCVSPCVHQMLAQGYFAMTVKIMKFGGSSFRDANCYRSVSAHIARSLANDADQAVVIVSAMYGVTDSLKRLAFSVNEQCDGAALDAVLTTGEMVSAGLLETALERHSVPVSSLFGYSLGIQTSAGFNRACIENIDKTPLLGALQVSRVVIVAGAQGADKSGRMSMLGRNSSDLTAVVAADIVGSRTCEIYSDVCGVYTCDPHLVNGPRLIPEISYASVSRMARFGAKVLYHGAVEYASTRDIVISCKSLVPREIVGTLVSGVGDAAIVVINTSAKKVKFAGSSQQQAALALLDALEITWVKGSQAEGFDVYLSHDADFAIKKFAIAGIELLDISAIVLVTQIDQDKQTVYELQDIESAVSCAQRLHAALYPQEELPAARP